MIVRFFLLGYKNIPVQRQRFKDFAQKTFTSENKTLNSLNYIFCSDKYLININKKYLHHNYYTDIITFDLSEDEKLVNAEIYISLERVKDNAKYQKTTFKNELHRVMLHGILHLCGYKDKSLADKRQMRRQEDKYLKIY